MILAKLKNVFQVFPELYLIAAILYYWTLTANLFNPIAIGLLLVFGYQCIAQKALLGIILSSIFICLNLYLILALISELSEFPEADTAFYKMLGIGGLFIGLNILAGGFMMKKYIDKSSNND